MQGKADEATAVVAHLAGSCDAQYTQSRFQRELSEQRAHDMTEAAITAIQPAVPLAAWLTEGAAMSGEVLTA